MSDYFTLLTAEHAGIFSTSRIVFSKAVTAILPNGTFIFRETFQRAKIDKKHYLLVYQIQFIQTIGPPIGRLNLEVKHLLTQ